MSVRWKPLLILSGFFLVTAAVGLTAIVFVLMPSDASKILEKARAERQARQFDRAAIQYQRALQVDGKNPAIHEEFAQLCTEWAQTLPAEKQRELLAKRLGALAEAVRLGKDRVAPRRQLLLEAIRWDEPVESSRWARELLSLVPDDPDALFVLVQDDLQQSPPQIAEARKHLDLLNAKEPDRLRTLWLRARLALAAEDNAGMEAVLAEVRPRAAETPADPADRLALLRLLAFDVQRAADGTQRLARTSAFERVARIVADEPDVLPGRIAQLGDLVGQVRRALVQNGDATGGVDRDAVEAVAAQLDQTVETTFAKAVEGRGADLRVYQSYAEYLLDRGQRERCLDVVVKGLDEPSASQAVFRPVAMGLREIAIRATLAQTDDPDRFAKAAPFIKEMIAGGSPADQGVGHLFQGAIDLERSGLAGGPPSGSGDPAEAEALRSSALKHLKIAAAELPRLATAQALYGVTLILSKEPALGRQYLQAARRLGPLETKYQLWAAWSMVQAGYPEEAEPIVAGLLQAHRDRGMPRELEATIRMLEGAIAQSRRGAADLKKAQEEYLKALASSPEPSESLELRLAQVDLQRKETEAALNRLLAMRQAGRGGPEREQLIVIAYQAAGRLAEAREALAAARAASPDHGDLAILDATLALRDDRPEDAERILATFLERKPDYGPAVVRRAQILADRLNRPDQARGLLKNLAETQPISEHWIQLAEHDLKTKNYRGMAEAAEQVRQRWPEAAAADLLDAQLALASRRDFRAAAAALDAALKKDPDNKVALFWKAQIDEMTGASAEATKVYEGLVRDRPMKELDAGLSLTTAAQSALATQALDQRELDTAISRFGELLKSGGSSNASLARAVRWKLAEAMIAKGKWPTAKAEILELLKDPATTPEEKVRAADAFRRNREVATAIHLLEGVLQADPGQSAAALALAYLLSESGKVEEAAGLMNRAIAAGNQPPAVHLMKAAVENLRLPKASAQTRALAALDGGLAAHPESVELIQAKYRLLQGDDPAKALAFLERAAETATSEKIRRLLAEAYRERGDFQKAEQVVDRLLQEQPREPSLLALKIRIAMTEAARAAERGDSAVERRLDEKALALLTRARSEHPQELAFPRAEWEIAMRRGDLKRALALAQEIDGLAPGLTVGPLLKAQVYAAQGRTPDVADAYAEALERDPRRSDLKLLLAQTRLAMGKADEALRLATAVAEADPTQRNAVLIRAKALAGLGGPPAVVQQRREQAVAVLQAAVAEQPQFREAYHVRAEIENQLGRRDQAIAALETGLKANPDDSAGLSLLVQLLTDARDRNRPPSPADLARAKALADAHGGSDSLGEKSLAIAIGYQRARQFELAIPWADRAAGLLQSPTAYLNQGDILLAAAEHMADSAAARDLFRRAVAAYDKVLETQGGSVEAINNKAWILHRYLDDNATALAMVEGVIRRADPSTLPAEFFDTVGAIHEKAGKIREAEDAYAAGLKKSPDHPVLNFHMGRLLLAEGGSARRAQGLSCLRTAQEAGERLPAAIRAELETLLARETP